MYNIDIFKCGGRGGLDQRNRTGGHLLKARVATFLFHCWVGHKFVEFFGGDLVQFAK